LFTHNNLADVTNSLEGGDTETSVVLGNELEKLANELGPPTKRKLDGGDGGNTLRGNKGGLVNGGCKSLEKGVLEGSTSIFGKCHPALRERGLVHGILKR
jgi:hypothetical protein